MSPAVRIARFAVVLVVAGLLGAGLGAAVGPIDVDGGHDPAPATSGPSSGSHPDGGHDADPADESTEPEGTEPEGTEAEGHDAEGHDAEGHDAEGHDLDEPFEVPAVGPQEDGS